MPDDDQLVVSLTVTRVENYWVTRYSGPDGRVSTASATEDEAIRELQRQALGIPVGPLMMRPVDDWLTIAADLRRVIEDRAVRHGLALRCGCDPRPDSKLIRELEAIEPGAFVEILAESGEITRKRHAAQARRPWWVRWLTR